MSFLLVEFVVQVGCARMDHAVHSMFARVGMSAPMEGVHLADHAVLVTVEYVS